MNVQHSTAVTRATLLRAQRLERAGAGLARWSLVFLLVFFGALKWTAHEAESIRPLIVNSPLLWWIDRVFGPQGASEFIGLIELATATLIAARRWAPRLAMVGGVLGIGMFVATLRREAEHHSMLDAMFHRILGDPPEDGEGTSRRRIARA